MRRSLIRLSTWSLSLLEPGDGLRPEREGVLEQEELRGERRERPRGVGLLHGDVPPIERGADRRGVGGRVGDGLGGDGRRCLLASAGGIVRGARSGCEQDDRDETTHECLSNESVNPSSYGTGTGASTCTSMREARPAPRYTRWLAFLKSDGLAL